MIEIAKAIKSVMDEINWIAKNLTVWTWSSSYKWVSDRDVKEKIREAMIKNWLSILPIWVNSKIKIDRWEEADSYNKWAMKTKQSIFTEVETKYLLLHISWESVELAWYGQWVDTQDKWAWKATTYALKNTLLNMFLVPTGIDTDDTHSDDLPVPQKKEYSKTETKWYNDTDKNIDKWADLIADWKTTPQEIIDKIESQWFTINKTNKEKILKLSSESDLSEMPF